LPVDQNPCTKDLCSNSGVASNSPVAADTPCGAGLVCDGQTHCVCADPGAGTGKCGTVTDACGHQVPGSVTCSGYDTCGGGGTAHACGCTPHAPAACGYGVCGGFVPDGCGGTVPCANPDPCVGGACGSCQGYCAADNYCQCDPTPCS
ncbi:MAG TPA: hypothetical protein VNG33_14060, partial [Polyangiaceae bacterium]|nr:hypothetical protein [Polyangiaceae bacterium]